VFLNPLFHAQQGHVRAQKDFKVFFVRKPIIFISSSSVMAAGLPLLSSGGTEVLPAIKVY